MFGQINNKNEYKSINTKSTIKWGRFFTTKTDTHTGFPFAQTTHDSLVAALSRVRRLALGGGLVLGGLALGAGNRLDLVGPSLSLLLLLLLLGLLNSGIAVGLADSSRLVASRHNLLPSGANNGTLDLGGAAGLALDGLLGGALLVQAAEEDGPVELARVLLGQEVRLGLAVQEAERLAVHTDKDFAAARVDLATRECTDFGPTQ